MLVSRLNRSALMKRVAVEPSKAKWPAGQGPRARSRAGGLLFGSEAAHGGVDRHKPRDGGAIARDRDRRAGFDLADEARERLVCLSQGDNFLQVVPGHGDQCSTSRCYMKGRDCRPRDIRPARALSAKVGTGFAIRKRSSV